MLRAGVLGVDRGQVLAGQALGMTPALMMRRIIAPQGIRTMIPDFGNETVSALKNSSLASVISVEELTLRSTQLASSTFDFFSIFFASGLIYLGLTSAVSVIQLFVERALDLDRPTSQGRLAIFLPWRRADLAGTLTLAEQPSAPAIAPQNPPPDELPAPSRRATSRVDRAKHAAMVERNNVAVEVTDLRKNYGNQTVLNGLDLTVRVGEVVALLGPSGSGKSTLVRCINHLEDWDSGMGRALAPKPSVLLLDEPTSALDPELVNEVLEVIRRLAVDDGLTMIIATHQIRFADEVADRVAFLSGGSILEQGPAHEILTNPSHPVTARFLSVMEGDDAPESAA